MFIHIGASLWVTIAIALCMAGSAQADQPFASGGSDHVQVPASPFPGSSGSVLQPEDQNIPRNTLTVPMWNGAYQVGGATYFLNMVGTNPFSGSATTTVPVVIVPLRLAFDADGSVLDNPGMAADAVGSPLFQPSQFVTGDTQYTDAYQRGSFWAAVSTTSPDYHVLLGEPLIVSTQTVHVPAPDGLTTFNAQAQRRFGLIDAAWFSHRIKQLVGSLHVAPTTVVMFLAEDAFVSNQPPANCLQGPNCLTFSGFHDSQVNGDNEPNNQPAQSVNTFIYASYDDFGNEVPPGVDPGLMGLSHEVLEWMNDPLFLGVHQDNPFTNQTLAADAPNWTSPFDPQCSPTYEVADPVAPLGIGVPTPGGPLYVLSDAAFFSWFAREQPSTAIGGLYDIAGALTGPSTPC